MRPHTLWFLLALMGCDETATPEMSDPSVTPQAITYPDIEANELHGASCAYAAGTSMAPIVIAYREEAVMKIDGKIRRFLVDAESGGAQLGSNSRYLAEDRVLLLTSGSESAPAGAEAVNFTGTVRLMDGAGSVLFSTEGTVQCGA